MAEPREAKERKPLQHYKQMGDDAAVKINADSAVSTSLHEAVERGDAPAVARILNHHGIADAQPEHITLLKWSNSASSPSKGSGTAKPQLFRCTKYVYELVATWDPWGGLDWRVVESCAALQEV